MNDVNYHSISTGKLRRYFDWNNLKDPFKVMRGALQAYRLIKRLQPQIILSKGGFVSVPVILGGRLNKVPIIIHESDITPGLANKISIPFATRVCTTFPETMDYLPQSKAVHVGAVTREELKKGSKSKGLQLTGFQPPKPVLLIMGGSLGSIRLNEVIRSNLPTLLSTFQIVHICGKGGVDSSFEQDGYRQYEYLKEELPDILALTSIVVTRAGSNSIHEFLALRKPMLLIPLSEAASRGDQILNARSFQKLGYGEILLEEELTDHTLVEMIHKLYEQRYTYIDNMLKRSSEEAILKMMDLIESNIKIYD